MLCEIESYVSRTAPTRHQRQKMCDAHGKGWGACPGPRRPHPDKENMSAFRDYYMISVEDELGRKATEAETEEAKQLYIKGWHPARTAAYLNLQCNARDEFAVRALLKDSEVGRCQ